MVLFCSLIVSRSCPQRSQPAIKKSPTLTSKGVEAKYIPRLAVDANVEIDEQVVS